MVLHTKYFILIFLVLTGMNTTAQVEVKSDSNNAIIITYYNDSSKTVYFTRPDYYLLQKVKKSRTKYYIRDDMYSISNDTLTLYFTDTTHFMRPKYQVMDGVQKQSGFPRTDSLFQYNNIRFKINFPKIKYYNYLCIKYNFGYRRADFFNNVGVPVKEIYLNR